MASWLGNVPLVVALVRGSPLRWRGCPVHFLVDVLVVLFGMLSNSTSAIDLLFIKWERKRDEPPPCKKNKQRCMVACARALYKQRLARRQVRIKISNVAYLLRKGGE